MLTAITYLRRDEKNESCSAVLLVFKVAVPISFQALDLACVDGLLDLRGRRLPDAGQSGGLRAARHRLAVAEQGACHFFVGDSLKLLSPLELEA